MLNTKQKDCDRLMLFSQLVSGLSDKCAIELLRGGPAPDVTDVALLDGREEHYDDGIVYFGYASQFAAAAVLPCQFIAAGDGKFPDGAAMCCAARTKESDLFLAFNLSHKLIDLSTGRGLYDELIAIADQKRDIAAILNTAAVRLGNSLVFSDAEYRVISSASSIPVVDPLWVNYIRQGYCPYEFVSGAAQLESVRMAPFTTDSFEVTCSESPYQKLASKVLVHGVQVGFVLMIASETRVTLAHFDMLKSVGLALAYEIEKYDACLFRGIDRYQQVLYSLLIGASAEDLAPQLSALKFSGSMAALCVRQKRYLGQQHLKTVIGDGLCRALPGTHTAYYEDNIAAVLPLEDGISLRPETLEILSSFSEKQFVSIGVSYSFTRIENFAAHYQQALAALDMAGRFGSADGLVQYGDYAFFDLLGHCSEGVKPGMFCHPALELLRQHDLKNGSELYKTLRCYVDTGGSIKDTAEKLFIHRNSLSYRLDCIGKIVGIDINDPATQYALRFSFDIDRYMGLDK